MLANHRLTLAMGGEGSGKSFDAALFGIAHSIYDLQWDGSLYWIVGADFEDARMEFNYVRDFEEKLGNIAKLNQTQARDQPCTLLTKTGQTFVTISSYDFTKLGREEPDGIIGAEVSRWYQEAFSRCESRLTRKFPRAWGFFSGSFETSHGWLPDMFRYGSGPNERDIRSYSVPSWSNKQRYPLGRQDPAILVAEAALSPSKFLERFAGVPAPAKALIFSEFRANLHVDPELEYDYGEPVYLAIDPGTKVYCVLFVQIIAGEIHVVDEIYASRWTHEQVINEVKGKTVWPLIKSGAIDIAAKQQHMGLPIPLQEWYKDTSLSLWANKLLVNDSIEKVRWALSPNPHTYRPRLSIHPRCRGIIAEMGGGPSPVEGGGSWRYYESAAGLGPPKAENDHACKALAYLLAGPISPIFTEGTLSASYLTTPRQPHWKDVIGDKDEA